MALPVKGLPYQTHHPSSEVLSALEGLYKACNFYFDVMPDTVKVHVERVKYQLRKETE